MKELEKEILKNEKIKSCTIEFSESYYVSIKFNWRNINDEKIFTNGFHSFIHTDKQLLLESITEFINNDNKGFIIL